MVIVVALPERRSKLFLAQISSISTNQMPLMSALNLVCAENDITFNAYVRSSSQQNEK